MNFRGKSAPGDLSGFLDQGSHFEGELRFEQSFRIDGKVCGTIRSEGDLVVGERGEIEGEIRVGRLFVSGIVRGEVRASKRLAIHARGRVEGDRGRAAWGSRAYGHRPPNRRGGAENGERRRRPPSRGCRTGASGR